MATSCTTFESTVQNSATDYTAYPIVSTHKFLQQSLALGDYSLVFDRAINNKEDLPNFNLLDLFFTDKSTFSGGKYAFYREKAKLCDVYIYQKSNMTTKNGMTAGTSSRYIEVVKGQNDVQKYEIVSQLGSDVFLSVNDGTNVINIENYYNPNSKQGSIFKPLTGYKITVNGKEYGILAFYRTPVLYELKTALIKDTALKDDVTLYVLASWESWTMK
jgi:hypothetical protein